MNISAEEMDIIDKVILLMPEDTYFRVSSLIDATESDPKKKLELAKYYDTITHFFTSEKLIERPIYGNVVYILTEKGKMVKSAGGFSKYEKNLLKANSVKKWYEIGKDYFLPIIAIIISIMALGNSFREDDKNQVNNEKIEDLNFQVQSIEERQKELDLEYVKHIDSLYFEINKLKKNTLK